MKYLPYCVFMWPHDTLAALPVGVDGQPVLVVGEAGLGAAVSAIPGSELNPEISRLRAFERVVEWFHERWAVLPMRYGCLLEDLTQVLEVLREHREEYQALLEGLAGAVEMTIRVLTDTEAAAEVPPIPAESGGPGAAYLARLRDQYAAADRAIREADGIADRLCRLLAGTFVRSQTEPASRGGTGGGKTLASVHFLVKRGAVASFREAVERLRGRLPGGMLVSGPWPPYNFVDSSPREEAGDPAGLPQGGPAHV